MAEAELDKHCSAMENEPSTTTCSASTTTITTTSTSRTQLPQISVYSGSDRHAVQVIQQALHRPPSSAAQYLQQMYAAQQQHLMLQTAALQQQHLSSTQFQSLATVPQVSVCGSLPRKLEGVQGKPVRWEAMYFPHWECHSAVKHVADLDNKPFTDLQHHQQQYYPTDYVAREYLSNPEFKPGSDLIFTPATTVAAVQSDIPVVSSSSSSSCQSAATQVQNLTLRSQKLGVLSSSQNGPPKSSSQTQSLSLCANKPVSSTKGSQPESSESNRKGDSPTPECRSTPVTRTSSIHQLITPAQQSVVVSPPPSHSPSQSPTIIIHPQALIQPQANSLVPAALQPEQSAPQQTTTSPVRPLAQPLNLPSHLPLPPSSAVHIGSVDQPSLVSQGQQIVSSTPHQQYSALQSTPIPLAAPPQLSTSSTQIQQLPLQSVQSLQVQPEILSQGQVLVQNTLVSEEELPAAEALVQLPFQTLPPPQTVAVNLQVQPSVPIETPVIYQVENVCEEEMPEESDCVNMVRTPTPPTLSPPAITLGNGDALNSEEPLSAATTRSSSTSMPNSIPSLENKPPQAIVKPQILTHVIEGFVIQEGLEPFPVSRSSLLVEQPAEKRLLVEGQIMSVMCVESDLQNTKHADNSSDTEIEDMIAEEGLDEIENELLKCEFCGKMGYPSKFLRSKRFCSTSCAKRHSLSCTKKFGLFASDKTSRWNRKSDSQSLGRRGRRPSGPDGAPRDHFLRQLPVTYPSAEEDMASHEDAVPTAMTTRLRRQSERERERELRELRIRKMPESINLLPVVQSDPSVWTVDEVWAFIHSLPGCQDIADEFRAQEIDGQALLLLKEDHLMSAMNIKLGPALKICARINSLKES
ncbi:UNVERIFIED_CONTAM: hypothetical protein H355_000760 [Colinus virginianus]|nr:hypothetical protein H355_000760 [Colinus virginianus]